MRPCRDRRLSRLQARRRASLSQGRPGPLPALARSLGASISGLMSAPGVDPRKLTASVRAGAMLAFFSPMAFDLMSAPSFRNATGHRASGCGCRIALRRSPRSRRQRSRSPRRMARAQARLMQRISHRSSRPAASPRRHRGFAMQWPAPAPQFSMTIKRRAWPSAAGRRLDGDRQARRPGPFSQCLARPPDRPGSRRTGRSYQRSAHRRLEPRPCRHGSRVAVAPRRLPGGTLTALVATKWSRCAAVKAARPGYSDLPLVLESDFAHASLRRRASARSWQTRNTRMAASAFRNASSQAHRGAGRGPPSPPPITGISWRGMRCRVTVESNAAGLHVDLRLNWKQAASSIVAAVKEMGPNGEASLLSRMTNTKARLPRSSSPTHRDECSITNRQPSEKTHEYGTRPTR